jgi:hypothetical protein
MDDSRDLAAERVKRSKIKKVSSQLHNPADLPPGKESLLPIG